MTSGIIIGLRKLSTNRRQAFFKKIGKEFDVAIPSPVLLFSGDSSNKGSSEKKQRPNQKHKEACRDVAQTLWRIDPKLTIPKIAGMGEILNACGGKKYTVNTIRKWIKDLNPDASPGRRKNT